MKSKLNQPPTTAKGYVFPAQPCTTLQLLQLALDSTTAFDAHYLVSGYIRRAWVDFDPNDTGWEVGSKKSAPFKFEMDDWSLVRSERYWLKAFVDKLWYFDEKEIRESMEGNYGN